jgi:hypothetical protein
MRYWMTWHRYSEVECNIIRKLHVFGMELSLNHYHDAVHVCEFDAEDTRVLELSAVAQVDPVFFHG